MTDQPTRGLPWSGSPGTHPIMIETQDNPAMGMVDVHIFVGAFKTTADAEAYAHRIAEFLRESANAQMDRVQ